MKSMRDQIVVRIERQGEGKVFSAKDFLDIASRTTVDVTLAELACKGIRCHLAKITEVVAALEQEISQK
jgi:hypothetical protein